MDLAAAIKDVGVPLAMVCLAMYLTWKLNDRMAKALDLQAKENQRLTREAVEAITRNTIILKHLVKKMEQEESRAPTEVLEPLSRDTPPEVHQAISEIQTDRIPSSFLKTG